MSMGKGGAICISRKQKINTHRSTEAEQVGVNDALTMRLWTESFGQGYKIKDNILFQDNESAMLLENNGKRSSGKQTQHIEIRYFFITDQVEQKHVQIAYCPTDRMPGDFLTKPTQGTPFRVYRQQILHLDPNEFPYYVAGPQECLETQFFHKRTGSQPQARTYTEVAKQSSDVAGNSKARTTLSHQKG